MTDPLESLLVETLAERADGFAPPPGGVDLGDRARRRRLAPVLAAAVVAVVLVAVGATVVALRPDDRPRGTDPDGRPSGSSTTDRAPDPDGPPRIPWSTGTRVTLPGGDTLDLGIDPDAVGSVETFQAVGPRHVVTTSRSTEGFGYVYVENNSGRYDAVATTTGAVVRDPAGARAAWVGFGLTSDGAPGPAVLHVASTDTGDETTFPLDDVAVDRPRVVGWVGDRVVLAPSFTLDGQVALDVTDGSSGPIPPITAVAPVTGLLAGPVRDRSGIVVTDADGTRLWQHPATAAEAVAFSPDGRRLLLLDGRLGGRYEVRDAETGRVLWAPPFPVYSGRPSPVVQLVWEDDEHVLVVEGLDDATTERVVRVGGDERVHEVLPSRNGGYRLLAP